MDYLMAAGKQSAPSISITKIPIYFNISPERSVTVGDLKKYIVFLLQSEFDWLYFIQIIWDRYACAPT